VVDIGSGAESSSCAPARGEEIFGFLEDSAPLDIGLDKNIYIHKLVIIASLNFFRMLLSPYNILFFS
jgi:hypothetical protein